MEKKKKERGEGHHSEGSIGDLNPQLRSMFKNSVFCLGLGEIFLALTTKNFPFVTSDT